MPGLGMTPRLPVILTPEEVPLFSGLYREITAWPFPDSPFYVAQVKRLLENDIPQFLRYEGSGMWLYREAGFGDEIVGFGCLTISDLYSNFLDGQLHSYIPLLAKHPAVERRGIGKAIVEHLEEMAKGLVFLPGGRRCASDHLFLDVYCENEIACGLYRNKCGFELLNENNPIVDPDEGGKPYYVMSKTLTAPTESGTVS